MQIFWRLMLGHMLADFTFQTNFINHWKRTSVWGMLAHCAMHPLAYVILTAPFLMDNWISTPYVRLQGWVCILIIFATHFIEDEWRVTTIFKYKVPDNTLYFFWDQIIHYVVIFAVIPMGLGSGPVDLFPEKWPILGCLFVMVTHAATVLVYFIEKDIQFRAFPGFQEKCATMLERLILSLCFLVPSNVFLLLALAWLGFMRFVRVKRLLDLSAVSFYLGGLIAVLCGLAARMVYYR